MHSHRPQPQWPPVPGFLVSWRDRVLLVAWVFSYAAILELFSILKKIERKQLG